MVRAREEVLASFMRFKGWHPPGAAMEAYLERQEADADRFTCGREVLSLDFNQLMGTPVRCARRLADHLGLPWRDALAGPIQAFIDPGLRHHGRPG